MQQGCLPAEGLTCWHRHRWCRPKQRRLCRRSPASGPQAACAPPAQPLRSRPRSRRSASLGCSPKTPSRCATCSAAAAALCSRPRTWSARPFSAANVQGTLLCCCPVCDVIHAWYHGATVGRGGGSAECAAGQYCSIGSCCRAVSTASWCAHKLGCGRYMMSYGQPA